MTSVALALSTVFGIGYVRFAPGTFGSAAGLLVWWLLPESTALHAVVIVVLFGLGAWSGNIAERHFGTTDPSPVVLDEVIGMLITLLGVHTGIAGAFVGFLLFRAADIVKPYPANRLEALHGGLGVMADDAMAGVYSNLALRLALAVSQAFLT
jgi:phosphatidylglycerophosphatase A